MAAGRVPHVPQLRDRVPRGRHQVPLPAEPQERDQRARRSQRRTLLATAAAGAAFIPVARIADSLDVNYHSKVIRPPGAVEERAFLERCIRCAECMKVCPNNALHPAMFEAGIEGLWTPILIARIGYCEHSCVLCGQVCPTGAIQKITEKEKLGHRRAASEDRHRVLRPRPLPAVEHADALHRLRGVLPDVAQGDLGRRGRGAGPRQQGGPERRAAGDEDREAPAPARRSRRSASAAAPARRCARCRISPPSTSRASARRRSKTNVILLENTNYNQKS